MLNAVIAFEPAKVLSEYQDEVNKLKEQNDELAKALGKTIIERDWAVGKLKSLDLLNKKSLVDSKRTSLSKTRQCELLRINRSTIYYKSKPLNGYNLNILNRIDEIYTDNPEFGYRYIHQQLVEDGFVIGINNQELTILNEIGPLVTANTENIKLISEKYKVEINYYDLVITYIEMRKDINVLFNDELASQIRFLHLLAYRISKGDTRSINVNILNKIINIFNLPYDLEFNEIDIPIKQQIVEIAARFFSSKAPTLANEIFPVFVKLYSYIKNNNLNDNIINIYINNMLQEVIKLENKANIINNHFNNILTIYSLISKNDTIENDFGRFILSIFLSKKVLVRDGKIMDNDGNFIKDGIITYIDKGEKVDVKIPYQTVKKLISSYTINSSLFKEEERNAIHDTLNNLYNSLLQRKQLENIKINEQQKININNLIKENINIDKINSFNQLIFNKVREEYPNIKLENLTVDYSSLTHFINAESEIRVIDNGILLKPIYIDIEHIPGLSSEIHRIINNTLIRPII